ncbi:MAG: flagellar hook-associated protein FlgL [Clostridiaceae bacterium]|nr:flagellar hook-associated protein FlgL [Clostridiaceae bacterium]
MRITNQMLSNNFLSDMRNNLENLETLQQQMSSGKEIRKPSDDPFKVSRAMQLTTDINANKQFNSNISDTSNWLDTTDSALGQVGEVFQRVRELLVSAGNAGYGPTQQKAIKDEINSKIGEFTQIMNTNFNGQYIFGGSRANVKPLETITDTSNNSKLVYYSNSASNPELDITSATGIIELNKLNSKVSVEISQGVNIQYNISAGDLLQFKSDQGQSVDLRQLLTSIVNHLDGKTDDGTAVDSQATNNVIGKDLQGITDTITNFLKYRSEVGAKQNRMDSAKSSNEVQNFNMTDILSKTEDIDITQKTIQFSNAQSVYMAALQTSARIIQPTLLDYLR